MSGSDRFNEVSVGLGQRQPHLFESRVLAVRRSCLPISFSDVCRIFQFDNQLTGDAVDRLMAQ